MFNPPPQKFVDSFKIFMMFVLSSVFYAFNFYVGSITSFHDSFTVASVVFPSPFVAVVYGLIHLIYSIPRYNPEWSSDSWSLSLRAYSGRGIRFLRRRPRYRKVVAFDPDRCNPPGCVPTSDTDELSREISDPKDPDSKYGTMAAALMARLCDDCCQSVGMSPPYLESADEKIVRNAECRHIARPVKDLESSNVVAFLSDALTKANEPIIAEWLVPIILWFGTYVGLTSTPSKVACCLQLIHALYPGGSVRLLIRIIEECMDHKMTGMDDTVKTLEYYMEKLEGNVQSGSYPVLIKIVTIIGCLPLLEKLGIKDILGKCGMLDLKIVRSGMRADEMILDLARNVLVVVKHFVNVRDDDKMGFNQFAASVSMLRHYESNRSYGDETVANKMKNHEYISLMCSCHSYERAVMARFSAMDAASRNDHSHLFNVLDAIIARNYNETGDFKRPAPIVIGITGVPGTGKTVLAKRLVMTVFEALGYTGLDETSIFEKNTTEWFDGYNPAIHRAVIYDELGCLKAQHGGKLMADVFKNLLTVTSEQPMLTPQAIAEKKSQIYLKADVIVLMSNDEEFGARAYLTDMNAFGRRFHLKVHITAVKEAYRHPDDGSLMPGKVPLGELDTIEIVQQYWQTDIGFTPVIDSKSNSVVLSVYNLLDMTRVVTKHQRALREAGMRRLQVEPVRNKCSHGFYSHCEICGLEGLPKEVLNRVNLHSGVVPTSLCTFVSVQVLAHIRALRHVLALRMGPVTVRGKVVTPTRKDYILACCVMYISQLVVSMITITGIGLWGLAWVSATTLGFFMDFQPLQLVAMYCDKRLQRGSMWLLHSLTAPPSIEAAIQRMEDRMLSRHIAVKRYRGIIRMLTLVVTTCAFMKSVQYVYKKTRKEEVRTAGESNSEPVVLTPETMGRPASLVKAAKSVWAFPEVYTPFGASSCNSLGDKLLDNTVRFVVGGSNTHALCVKSQYFIYASHTDILDKFVVVQENKGTKEGPRWIEIFSGLIPSECVGVVNGEVNVVFIPGVMPRRDITGWLFKKPANPGNRLDVASVNFAGGVPTIDKGVGVWRSYICEGASKMGLVCDMSQESYNGRCGTACYLRIGKQECLYGINVAGTPGTSINIYEPVDLESLDKSIRSLKPRCVVATNGVSFDDKLASHGLAADTPITRLHHHHFCEQLGTEVLLSVDPSKRGGTLQSDVITSPCIDDVFSVFPAMRHTLVAPIFKHGYYEGKYVSMEGNALRELTQNHSRNFNISLLDTVVEHIFSKWNTVVEGGSLHVLTVDTACRGTSSLKHFNALKRGTSAGFGLRGHKGDHMIPGPAPDAPDGFVVSDEVKILIGRDLDSYCRGMRSNSVFIAHFKDEPRKKERVDQRMIRMFAGGELSYLVISKALLGMFVDAFLTHPHEFETACGINCFGPEWAVFAKRHEGGSGVVISDFKWYDKTMPALIIQYVFTLIIRLCRVWYDDWTEAVEEVARGVMTECCFPIYLLDGLFVGFANSNPSGHLLTLIVNGIAQSILMRYTYANIYGKENARAALTDFETHVVLTTLGDDGAQTIHDRPLYNYQTIKAEMANHGMTLTTASKEGVGLDYEPPGSAAIGKRSILHSEGRVLCPMEMPAIGKMITMCSRKDTIPVREKMALSYDAAACEFAMYGRNFYEANIGELRRIAQKYDYQTKWLQECTFDGIVSRFDKAQLTPHLTLDGETGGDLLDRALEAKQTSYTIVTEITDAPVVHQQSESSCAHPKKFSPCPSDRGSSRSDLRDGTSLGCGTSDPEMLSDTVIFASPALVTLKTVVLWMVLFMALLALIVESIDPVWDPVTKNLSKQLNNNMDSINDVAASETLGGASTKRSAENQTGGTLLQTSLETIIEQEHATTTFSQSVPAVGVDLHTQGDNTFSDGGTPMEAGLGEFLARPVQLNLGTPFKALQWTVATGVIGTSLAVIDPWTLWQADPKVKQKLSNFAYLKGQLKVRFVIAGTPFHYGRILVSYVPFAASNQILKQAITHCSTTVEGPLMYLSTLMSAELDPMSCAPVELTLPFMHFKNWMDVSTPETLGSLYLRQFVPLTRASDTAIATVAVTAFAWLEKAELCVPTLAVPTSGREQKIQPSISGISSSVAAAAGKMSKVPAIGPFMKATSIAATAAGDVAKIFGMSRPVDAEKPVQSKIITSSSMCLTQGASLAQKLTLDPQQELSIDPRTVGLPPNDEMTFESIVNRECWLTTVAWTDAGGPFTVSGGSDPSVKGALLFVSNVTPNLCKRIKTISGTYAGKVGPYQISQPTPSMFVARAFNFWRGTMVYRFRVIASSFHRGNLRITYDPLVGTQAEDINSQMTHVIDLSDARELIVRVPWCSQYPFLEVANQKHEPLENYSPSIQTATTNFAYVNYNKQYHNGVIMAAIVNQLVAPNSQPAYLVVSSWMEEGEFQSPSTRIADDYPVFATPTSGTSEVTIVEGKQSPEMSQVCFGERVTSVRSLLKRSTITWYLFPFAVAVNTNTNTTSFTLPAFPLYGHSDITNDKRAARVSYLTYFAAAYVARRGGVRYIVQWDDIVIASAPSSILNKPVYAHYTRSWDAVSPGTTGAINTEGYQLDALKNIVETGSSTRDQIANRCGNGYEGLTIANFSLEERLHEVEIPCYGGTRFALAQYGPILSNTNTYTYTMTANPAETGFQVWNCKFHVYGSTAYAPAIYSAAAEDFSLFWFQAAPPLYTYVGT